VKTSKGLIDTWRRGLLVLQLNDLSATPGIACRECHSLKTGGKAIVFSTALAPYAYLPTPVGAIHPVTPWRLAEAKTPPPFARRYYSDAQPGNELRQVLGGVKDPRARDLLWSFVEPDVQTEQSSIVRSLSLGLKPPETCKLASVLGTPPKAIR
jgi:hypothetical protein